MLVFSLIFLLHLLPVMVALFWRRRVRRRVEQMSPQIFAFLAGDKEFEGCGLADFVPRRGERRELARVIGTLAHSFADCRAERVRLLSTTWGVEEWLLGRVASPFGWVQRGAMEMLLRLSPSQRALTVVERCRFRHPMAALLRLQFLVYAKPSQVVLLVKHHPFELSWKEVGRVVETLKLRTPILEPQRVDGAPNHNTDILMLYMAQVEGVGDAQGIAHGLATTADTPLRRAATDTLWSAHRFPRIGD